MAEHPQIEFGVFVTPSNQDPQRAVALAELAERVGLDIVSFQDHPYQARFLDTWTLLSYVAARTSRVKLAPNLPHPAVAPARGRRQVGGEPRPAERRPGRAGDRVRRV